MSRRRPRQTRRRGALRSLGSLLSAGVSLAAVLAFAAPLVHVHLDARDAGVRDLCGEHGPALPVGADVAGACPVCIAGAHAPAALPRTATDLALLAPTSPLTPAPPAAVRAAAPQRAGDPRAPPRFA